MQALQTLVTKQPIVAVVFVVLALYGFSTLFFSSSDKDTTPKNDQDIDEFARGPIKDNEGKKQKSLKKTIIPKEMPATQANAASIAAEHLMPATQIKEAKKAAKTKATPPAPEVKKEEPVKSKKKENNTPKAAAKLEPKAEPVKEEAPVAASPEAEKTMTAAQKKKAKKKQKK